MTNTRRIFGILQLLGAVAAFSGPAKGMQIQLDGGNPYLCVVVQFAKTASGTPVIAAPCSGGPEDQWNWVNGHFEGIGTANGKTNCLNVAGPFSSGTPVDIAPCSTGVNLNQLWVGGFSFGGNVINAFDSAGKAWCLDSHGGPVVGGGTQLVINPCTGVSSQAWIMRGMQLQGEGKAPYVCANVPGSTTVVSFSCDDAPNELWNFQNTQFLGIGTENGSSTCLTATGDAAGSRVVLSTCSLAFPNSQWAIGTLSSSPGSSMGVVLVGNLELCLDRSSGGTELVVNTCNGSASQNWTVR